jgi:hypothetical protein
LVCGIGKQEGGLLLFLGLFYLSPGSFAPKDVWKKVATTLPPNKLYNGKVIKIIMA